MYVEIRVGHIGFGSTAGVRTSERLIAAIAATASKILGAVKCMLKASSSMFLTNIRIGGDMRV